MRPLPGARSRPPPGARATSLLLVLLLVAACAASVRDAPTSQAGTPPFHARFSPGRHLVTNEVAYADPSAGAPVDKDWVVTSGSLFADDGTGWTGRVDAEEPDPASQQHTGSAVFRLVTRRADFRDVRVRFDLDVTGLTTTGRTPARAYDGVHVFLRYQSDQWLYAVSVLRRDGQVAIKKKVPGGPANGGEYATLAVARYSLPLQTWNAVEVTAVDAPGGVQLGLRVNGRLLLRTTDAGALGAPIGAAGRVGIRGDNASFRFRGFSATSP